MHSPRYRQDKNLVESSSAQFITMSEKTFEEEGPPGEAAPEILDSRIWVDGCWDFFHHGPFL